MLQKTTLKKQAYEFIKNAIANSHYKTGIVYSEQTFATELGISRTPIREAIIQLKQEGYVNIVKNRGITIKKITVEEMEEIYQARAAIEGYCCMYAAGNIDTPEGSALLKAITELNKQEMEIYRNGADAVKYMQIDSEFHMAIIKFANNQILSEIIANLRSRINVLGVRAMTNEKRMPSSIKEHSGLIKSIKKGDRMAVVEQLENHLTASARTIKMYTEHELSE